MKKKIYKPSLQPFLIDESFTNMIHLIANSALVTNLKKAGIWDPPKSNKPKVIPKKYCKYVCDMVVARILLSIGKKKGDGYIIEKFSDYEKIIDQIDMHIFDMMLFHHAKNNVPHIIFKGYQK